MKSRISEEIYDRINNNIYELEGDRWWNNDFSLNLLKTLINPVRVRYSLEKIHQSFRVEKHKLQIMEIGCGGGLLLEEFAEQGFTLTGVDPSESSLITAIKHSTERELDIKYVKGIGEKLPFQSERFDVVLCCDVLEHVRDLPKVIFEVKRVLKKHGIFIYDTFNRSYLSKIGAIKILQDWKRWSIMPPGLHVWEMFIKPEEMKSLLRDNKLTWKEHQGIKPNISYLRLIYYLRQRVLGHLTYEEFGDKFRMTEGKSTQVMYIGYAIKL